MSDHAEVSHFPDGTAWRCPHPLCGYACGDDGPDNCPHHGEALQRLVMRINVTGEDDE